jgi:hypothetical protein
LEKAVATKPTKKNDQRGTEQTFNISRFMKERKRQKAVFQVILQALKMIKDKRKEKRSAYP